jgi:hypothetical protein
MTRSSAVNATALVSMLRILADVRTLSSRIATSLAVVVNAPLTRVGHAAAVLVLLTGCCLRGGPEQPVSEPPAAGAPQPAVEAPKPAAESPQRGGERAAPEPGQREPVETPAPTAATPAPPVAAEAPKPAVPQPEPPAVPKPGAAAPAPQMPSQAPAQSPRKSAAAPSAPREGTAPRPAPVKPAPSIPEPKAASVPPLDLNRLTQGLKDTKAIGLFSKLTLKNQMDDLLDWFRDYHSGKGKRSLTDLRRSYDLLVLKVLSLLQDEDRKLASDIVTSREAIWGLLADAKAFTALQV